MRIVCFLHNLRWNKIHPLPFQYWKEMSCWKGIEDLNIVSLKCEMLTSWCHQNTAHQNMTLQIIHAPMCFMNGLYHRGERLLFIFIFYQGLGQWGSLAGVILLQLQCTSIVFNLHIITAEFYLLKLLLQNSSDSMIL